MNSQIRIPEVRLIDDKGEQLGLLPTDRCNGGPFHLGFDAAPTVASVLVESLVVAALGGVIGIAIAYVGFNGLQTSTMNWSTYTQVGFAFVIDGKLALQAVAYALGIGFVGGLLPALRASRLTLAVALREA